MAQLKKMVSSASVRTEEECGKEEVQELNLQVSQKDRSRKESAADIHRYQSCLLLPLPIKHRHERIHISKLLTPCPSHA